MSPGNEEFKAEGRKQEQQQGARAVILSLEKKVAELQVRGEGGRGEEEGVNG